MKEYPIKDNQGNIVFTVKLFDDKSRIFIGEEEIITCRTVPLAIPQAELPALKNMESINDIIDYIERAPMSENMDYEIDPELDFFVNCSNLQAWVEHDFNTRLLDYMLSFTLLEELVKRGYQRAKMRLKEEILERYYYGSEKVRDLIVEQGLLDYLTTEEYYSPLPEDIRIPLTIIRTRMPKGKEVIENGKIVKITVYLDEYDNETISKEDSIIVQEEISKLKDLEELAFYDYTGQTDFSHMGRFPRLQAFSLRCHRINKLFDDPNAFPVLKTLNINGLHTESIPEAIGNLPTLWNLKVFGSRIKTLPESIGKLKTLYKLEIINCSLETLPNSIGNLKTLYELKIINCNLENLPESLGEITNLRELKIVNCPLKRLPESIGNISLLREIEIKDTALSSLPASFS